MIDKKDSRMIGMTDKGNEGGNFLCSSEFLEFEELFSNLGKGKMEI